ncbi:hypothetical protein EPN87_03260 [archaeon]|nr:MAG: hypothetical protein EPN87_03260 [archaeon]
MSRFDKSFTVRVGLRNRNTNPYWWECGGERYHAAHVSLVRATERNIATAVRILGIPPKDVKPLRVIGWESHYVAKFEVQTKNGYAEDLKRQLVGMYDDGDYEVLDPIPYLS